MRGQQAYRTNETIAQLQETARHALSILELDLRMAGYWGTSNRVERISNSATPGSALPADLASAAAGIDACGPNWAIDLRAHIGAHDDHYALACPAFNRRPQPGTDVLIVRRASTPVTAPPATPRLRLVANRAAGQLVIACDRVSNAGCGQFAQPPQLAGAQTHDLLAHAYYISRDATGRTGLPSLRRKRLVGGATGATIQDEEIAPGVEDMQVLLGIRANGVVQFVEPAALDPDASIIAVRVWLLVRAEVPEPGFTDDSVREFPPGRRLPAPEDTIRRLLTSTTVFLRNTRS